MSAFSFVGARGTPSPCWRSGLHLGRTVLRKKASPASWLLQRVGGSRERKATCCSCRSEGGAEPLREPGTAEPGTAEVWGFVAMDRAARGAQKASPASWLLQGVGASRERKATRCSCKSEGDAELLARELRVAGVLAAGRMGWLMAPPLFVGASLLANRPYPIGTLTLRKLRQQAGSYRGAVGAASSVESLLANQARRYGIHSFLSLRGNA
jgi:hypothetical protein